MPRARFLIPVLLTVVLLTGAVIAGCSSQDSGSSSGTGTSATTAPGGDGYTTVDVQTAYDALDADPAAQLIDVREPSEWAETGFPQGAALISLGDLEARAGTDFPKDQPVYAICRSGNRSRTAADILVGLGFTQVYNVDGGVTAWMAAGLPMETYQP